MGKQRFLYKPGATNIRDLICWKLLEKVGGFLFLNLRLLLLLGKPVLLEAAEETLFKRWNVGVRGWNVEVPLCGN